MPASERALNVTNTYRARTAALRAHAARVTQDKWAAMDPSDLDGSHARFLSAVVPVVTELQRANARLAKAYLAGFVSVETGRHASSSSISAPTDAIGQNQAGKSLSESLLNSVIAVKVAIKAGSAISDALNIGRDTAVRSAGEDVMYAGRDTLSSGISSDDRVVGWRRVTGGGCGACLAAADGAVQSDGSDLEIHPSCQCSEEPVVAGVPDRVQRPTGEQMFHAMSHEAQNQLLGPDKAPLVRSGDVPFHALIERSPMEAIPDQITEAPLQALHAHT